MDAMIRKIRPEEYGLLILLQKHGYRQISRSV